MRQVLRYLFYRCSGKVLSNQGFHILINAQLSSSLTFQQQLSEHILCFEIILFLDQQGICMLFPLPH